MVSEFAMVVNAREPYGTGERRSDPYLWVLVLLLHGW